jgi:hypothetical protein
MKTRVSGATYDVNRWILRIGGKDRRATRWVGNVGGETVLLASFVQPLSVTANNVSRVLRDGNTIVTAGPSTAVVTGGLGPFSYLWEITSGSATINSPTSAVTTFTKAVVMNNPSVTAQARLTVTDAQGKTATHTITATFGAIDPIGGVS